MDSKQYQINSLISAYRKPNTLPKLGSQNDTGPIIKKYTNKFTDGITREKVPIHVQASQEITSFARKCAPFSSNYKISPIKREEQKESTFFETRQQEKRNFRVRPQTPKLDVIQMSKLKNAKLSKIEKFKAPLQEIPSILKPINGNNSNSFKLSSMAKEEQLLPVYESGSKFGNLPDINAPVVSEAKRSVIKISKRKIKIKKQDFHNLSFTSKGKVEEDTSDEIVQFKQNGSSQKLVEFEDDEIKVNEADTDDELFFQPKNEPGVLFGAAYENKYIDILENEEIVDFDEINEKMLEISLGMTKEELSQLSKIEIKVDTTNTHMQYVGEILQSLTLLKLNDSVIPSMRDLGTSFRNIQILYLNRCEMKTLAGLSCFEFLKELYISYNDIDDIFDIGYCNNLEILDLEGNNISTWDNISYLIGCPKLIDFNISNNPISHDQNYQNRVKELLPQLKYLDDLHIGAIREDEPIFSYSKVENFSLTVLVERYFILSKFVKFPIGVDELEQLADEALDCIEDEDNEEFIVKTQVKRHERKNEAFENETFEMFNECQDSEFDNDSELDSSKIKDSQQRMFKSCTNGFMKRKSSDLISDDLNVSKFSAYDDSNSILRSSMQGFFTGRKKDIFTTKESTYNTCDMSEEHSPPAYNDRRARENYTKTSTDDKKIIFTNTGYSDNIEAKRIEDLIVEFSMNTNNFKQSMQSMDVASKLKENSQYSRAESCFTEIYNSPERSNVLGEKIKFFSKYQNSGKKVVPIKADRIIIKRHTIKSETK